MAGKGQNSQLKEERHSILGSIHSFSSGRATSQHRCEIRCLVHHQPEKLTGALPSFGVQSFYGASLCGGGGLVAKSCLTLVIPCIVTCQTPLSMGFSRQENWVGCYALLQGIFWTQGWNPAFLHCRRILYHLSHQGSLSLCRFGWLIAPVVEPSLHHSAPKVWHESPY